VDQKRLQLEHVNFPAALKERRASRRLSQLELALRAGTTQRHLSFIESGRSVPGREMVIRLTESLGLPLRERNDLLLKAGYAPAYPETPLDSPELAPILATLTHILDAHMPYPAIVIDRHGGIIAANEGQQLLTAGCAEHVQGNAYRLALHPDGMASRIANFTEWAWHVDRIRRRRSAASWPSPPQQGGRSRSCPLRRRARQRVAHYGQYGIVAEPEVARDAGEVIGCGGQCPLARLIVGKSPRA
jgi:transcriptional regulator with XRE-family HTH domain